MMPVHLFKRAYDARRPDENKIETIELSDYAYRDLMHFKRAYMVHEELLYK